MFETAEYIINYKRTLNINYLLVLEVYERFTVDENTNGQWYSMNVWRLGI
jgi:hypothetical protein